MQNLYKNQWNKRKSKVFTTLRFPFFHSNAISSGSRDASDFSLKSIPEPTSSLRRRPLVPRFHPLGSGMAQLTGSHDLLVMFSRFLVH